MTRITGLPPSTSDSLTPDLLEFCRKLGSSQLSHSHDLVTPRGTFRGVDAGRMSGESRVEARILHRCSKCCIRRNVNVAHLQRRPCLLALVRHSSAPCKH